MPGRAGRKSFRPRTVTRLHTRTKLPALAPFEPASRKLYVNWDEATEIAESGLREVAGSDMGDPRFAHVD
jgi:hypothetical protein